MCGIAGIIHKNAGKDVNIGEQMTAMLQALKHRGPDSTGYAMYGEDNGNHVVRFKVAEAADLEGSFDIHAAIEDRIAAVESQEWKIWVPRLSRKRVQLSTLIVTRFNSQVI